MKIQFALSIVMVVMLASTPRALAQAGKTSTGDWESIWLVEDRSGVTTQMKILELGSAGAVEWASHYEQPVTIRCIRGRTDLSLRASSVERIEVVESGFEKGNPPTGRRWTHYCKVRLHTGEEWDVVIPTTDYYGFIRKAEAAHGGVRLELQDIKSIRVLHGIHRQCPTCDKLFHQLGYRFCPFDGAKLNDMKQKDNQRTRHSTE